MKSGDKAALRFRAGKSKDANKTTTTGINTVHSVHLLLDTKGRSTGPSLFSGRTISLTIDLMCTVRLLFSLVLLLTHIAASGAFYCWVFGAFFMDIDMISCIFYT